MGPIFDSLWRAAVYCLHPRVIALSLLPLCVAFAATYGWGYFYWDPAVQWMQQVLEADLLSGIWRWLDTIGLGMVKGFAAPLLVIAMMIPVVVLLTLLVVAFCMTPALTRMVARRRYPGLEKRHGASFLHSLAWSLGSTTLALAALVVTAPLWLVPPLVVLPAVIWGWLTYRVMAFDALAAHASRDEQREIFRRHKGRLLLIGMVCGALGAAPSMLWASGVVFLAAAFVVLVPVALWMYTLVFAFSSLWFIHYSLAALVQLRHEAPRDGAAGRLAAQRLALPDDPDTAPFPGRDAILPPPHA